jgi:hypothetical protein
MNLRGVGLDGSWSRRSGLREGVGVEGDSGNSEGQGTLDSHDPAQLEPNYT